jgi:hypothetical protein
MRRRNSMRYTESKDRKINDQAGINENLRIKKLHVFLKTI